MQKSKTPMNSEKLSQLMDGESRDINPSEAIASVGASGEMLSRWSRYHLIRDLIKQEPVDTGSTLASRISAAIQDEPNYSNITSIGNQAQPAIDDTDASTDSATTTSTSEMVEPDSAVAESANVQVATPAKRSFWATGATGFALAASVAAVTVVGMNIWQDQAAVSPAAGLAVNATAEAGNNVLASEQGSPVADGLNSESLNVADAFSRQEPTAVLPEVELVANTGVYWVSPLTAERVPDEERLNQFLSQHIENSPTAGREGLLPYSRLVGYEKSTENNGTEKSGIEQ